MVYFSKVSVVVPIYIVEKMLAECINSLLEPNGPTEKQITFPISHCIDNSGKQIGRILGSLGFSFLMFGIYHDGYF